jgi:hypothetical protein
MNPLAVVEKLINVIELALPLLIGVLDAETNYLLRQA